MKKFKFNPSDLGEVLTREELKMVYGGSRHKSFKCSQATTCRSGKTVSCVGYSYCGYIMSGSQVAGVVCDGYDHNC